MNFLKILLLRITNMASNEIDSLSFMLEELKRFLELYSLRANKDFGATQLSLKQHLNDFLYLNEEIQRLSNLIKNKIEADINKLNQFKNKH
jgi:hypothetical protein